MAPDFKSYLATQIFAEKQTVSYRNVSRALKVHVNSAKCMLYEFYEKENKKKAGSIYATYLIAGTKKQEPEHVVTNGNSRHADEDEPMASSPPPPASSMPEPSQENGHIERETVSITTVSLVREEDLKSSKDQYEVITSIHVYSLSPGRLQDLVALTDIGRAIYADSFSKEDPLIVNKTYGVIQNPGVRRRKGKRPANLDAPVPKFQPTSDDKPLKKEPSNSTPANAPSKTEAENSRPGSRDSNTSASSKQFASLKRDGSNLFKAFAKAQKKPKLERQGTDASTNASASGVEDVKMMDADDEGESEDDAVFLDTGTEKKGTRKRASDIKQERETRAAELRRMMDSDDESEKAAPNIDNAAGITDESSGTVKGEEKTATVDDADENVAWSESDTEKAKQKPTSKNALATQGDEQVSTEPRRRRGKRKVMKKRTMKDEEGYLITKEEEVLESYSEDDEPEPPKEKAKTAFSSMKSQPSSQKSSGSAKASTQKKKGDIMSFFGKK